MDITAPLARYIPRGKAALCGAFLRGNSFEHGVYSGAAAGVQDSLPRRRRIARGAHGNPCGATGFGDYNAGAAREVAALPRLYFPAFRRKVISRLRRGYIRGYAAGYVLLPYAAKLRSARRAGTF